LSSQNALLCVRDLFLCFVFTGVRQWHERHLLSSQNNVQRERARKRERVCVSVCVRERERERHEIYAEKPMPQSQNNLGEKKKKAGKTCEQGQKCTEKPMPLTKLEKKEEKQTKREKMCTGA